MSVLLRSLLIIGIAFSIGVTYYAMLVEGDFPIFANPDGVPTIEEGE